MGRGRPTKYTQAISEQVCTLLMEGFSLRSICKRDDMPSRGTVFSWLARNEEFASSYARAREVQAEIMADEIVDISDDATNDYMERETKNGKVVLVAHDHINRSKLRVESRKWVAERLLPKKYGTRTLELTGAVGGPIQLIHSVPRPERP
jgi:hypothetical protein